MFRRVLIRQHERGLRFRGGEFIAPLEPGQFTLFVPPWDGDFETVEVVDTLKTRFDHPALETLLLDTELREHLLVIEVPETQRAVVYRDGHAYQLIGPGTHAYWKAPAEVEFELFDAITGVKPSHSFYHEIMALPAGNIFLQRPLVAAH